MKRTFLLLVALALVATACGDTSSDGVASLDSDIAELAAGDDVGGGDDGAPTTAEDATDEEALLAFAACMRDNGFDIPDPTVDADGNVRLQRPQGADGEGVDQEARRIAFESCGEFLEGLTQGRRNVDQTELQDQLFAFASCMRDNGFDMPDPDLAALGAGGGPGSGPFGDIDREDPAFQEAQGACEDILAGFGPGRGPGGPGGGGDG